MGKDGKIVLRVEKRARVKVGERAKVGKRGRGKGGEKREGRIRNG